MKEAQQIRLTRRSTNNKRRRSSNYLKSSWAIISGYQKYSWWKMRNHCWCSIEHFGELGKKRQRSQRITFQVSCTLPGMSNNNAPEKWTIRWQFHINHLTSKFQITRRSLQFNEDALFRTVGNWDGLGAGSQKKAPPQPLLLSVHLFTLVGTNCIGLLQKPERNHFIIFVRHGN